MELYTRLVSKQRAEVCKNLPKLKCAIHVFVCATCVKVNYRPFVVGATVGVAKRTATILEYNAWVFSMGQMYRECVCSSLAVNQNEQST